MFDLEKAITTWRQRLQDHNRDGHINVDELEGHLRDAVEDLISSDMSEKDAFYRAVDELGTEEDLRVEHIKAHWEKVAVKRSIFAPVLLANYIKVAIRQLRRYPGYSLINVLGLAIGMACCILILLYVQDELSYDQYHEKSDRIFRITGSRTVNGNPLELAITPPLWGPFLTRDYPEVENWTRILPPATHWFIRNGDTRFYEKGFFHADATVFEVFSFPLIKGNPKTALTDLNTVVISESMAAKYFGDEDPIGKTLLADERYTYTITGIMRDIPKNSHFHCDFFASLVTREALGFIPTTLKRGGGTDHRLYTYLLLQEGSDPVAFGIKLPVILDAYVDEMLKASGLELKPYLTPVTDIHLYSNVERELGVNSDIRYVYIFSSLALVILFIACINFMNLATARSANRAREVGMRKVVGAGRRQLMVQFLGESVLLSLFSMGLAVALLYGLLPLFNELSGKALTMQYTSSWLLFAPAGVALFVGVLAGSYPAFFLSSFRPITVLQGTLRAGVADAMLRKVLVVFQFAVSIAMIVGTGVVFSQLNYIQTKKLGFERDHVVVIPMPDQAVSQGYEAFKNAVLGYPEIISMGVALNVPGGKMDVDMLTPEGVSDDQSPTFQVNRADYDYIDAIGIEIIEGRNFSRAFPTDTNACLINEAAARLLGWDDPIGKTFTFPGDQPDITPITVIGVMQDFHNRSLHQKIEPFILFYSRPSPIFSMVIKIRGEDIPRAIGILQNEWNSTFSMEYTFLDEDFEKQYLAEQRLGGVFIAVAILSISIACLGLFGLASFMAEQRTREIGVRKALGARASDIVVLLSKDFTKLVAVSFVIGTPVIYYVMNEWLQEFPYRTDLGVWLFITAGLAAFVIAGLTVGYQALKAAWTNPADALQCE